MQLLFRRFNYTATFSFKLKNENLKLIDKPIYPSMFFFFWEQQAD